MNEPPKIVFVVNGHDDSLVRWSVGYLSAALQRTGVDSKVVDLRRGVEACDGADVVVVYRSFSDHTKNQMVRWKANGKYVMYFLDDYLFQPGCRYSSEYKLPIMDFLNTADCLVSSSMMLLSKMPDKEKILRRSVLDQEASQVLAQDYRRDKSVFVIGWLAGIGRRGFVDGFVVEFLSELDRELKGERCDFKCFGHYGLPKFANISVKSYPYSPAANWRGLYERFVDMDMGVSINVLDEADEFCRCKSELKLVETGTMGVPIVTSRVPPFTEVVKEGETGFFASTPAEFAKKILLVMRDESLARKVSQSVKNLVRDGYNVDTNAKQFLEDVMRGLNKWKKI